MNSCNFKLYITFCLYELCLCLSITDDSWEMLQDSNKQCLLIGLFQFQKKAASTYTKASNSRDVLAALHLMVMLQLENFLVCGKLSHICNSQMKFLMMSCNGELINHKSFGQGNKKFARFVIDFISVQLVFNNWYPFSTQFAPSSFSKNVPEEVESALKNNQMILINICICLDHNTNILFVKQGVKGWPVPTLKQPFSMAVTFKNKFKKGIILSWENYQANKASNCCLSSPFSLN
jgi:hypothetical protein